MIKITYDNKFNTKLVSDLEGKAKSKELELLLEKKLFSAKQGEIFVNVILNRVSIYILLFVC